MYNYDWFIDWLKRNLKKPTQPTFNTTAKYIAINFSRSYFNVTELDVENALKFLGFDFAIIDEKPLFSIDRSSPAFDVFARHWD